MTTIRTANHALATTTPGKALNVVLWTLQVLLALAFRGRWVRKAPGECRYGRTL